MTETTLQPAGLPPSVLTKRQRKDRTKIYTEDGTTYRIKARIRFDDDCNNGHNTFAITADIDRKGKNGQWYEYSGGCLHEDVAKHFPDLTKYLKWHLSSTDGPMHYVANTVFHASNRDCWGHKAGEPSAWSHAVQFGDNPIKHRIGKGFAAFLDGAAPHDFEVIRHDHTREPETFRPKYTLGGFAEKWHECPFDTEQEALDFLTALQTCEPKILKIAFSKGKERDFAAARHAAVWPEATDEQLSAEPEELKRVLLERLPALLAEFKADMEELGFVW